LNGRNRRMGLAYRGESNSGGNGLGEKNAKASW
jgi:hypothetical protein